MKHLNQDSFSLIVLVCKVFAQLFMQFQLHFRNRGVGTVSVQITRVVTHAHTPTSGEK